MRAQRPRPLRRNFGRVPGFGWRWAWSTRSCASSSPRSPSSTQKQLQEISPHHRGRLLLLYDEAGNLKCETCFQCAMACPIEIIDMGGVDTKNRYHVHWGPPEQYGERREESALRRSGRPVPDRVFQAWLPIDLGPLERILVANDYDPRRLLTILEASAGRVRTPAGGGDPAHQPLHRRVVQRDLRHRHVVSAISSFEPGRVSEIGICRCPTCTALGGGRIRDALVDVLGTDVGGVTLDGSGALRRRGVRRRQRWGTGCHARRSAPAGHDRRQGAQAGRVSARQQYANCSCMTLICDVLVDAFLLQADTHAGIGSANV